MTHAEIEAAHRIMHPGWYEEDACHCRECAEERQGEMAIIKLALAAAERARWQTADTAPKDGTWVLLARAGHTPMVAHWDGEYGMWSDDDCRGWPSADYWQSVPQPPEEPTASPPISPRSSS